MTDTRCRSPGAARRPHTHRTHRRPLGRFEQLEARHLLAVVINEFHYDPDNSAELVEFIELHNTGPAAVDLSDWRIDEGVDFAFPSGSTIDAGQYLVVTQNAAHFQAKFGFVPFGEWETDDKLSNDGETIELRDAGNQLVDSVTYKLGFPWPTSGEFGSSVELINPALDNSQAGNWRTSGYGLIVPQTLISPNSSWSYRKGITQNPPANWTQASFNPATDPVAWQAGTASIGFGDGDDATVLADMRQVLPGTPGYSSVYTRRLFSITGAIPAALSLRLYVDDGAIVFINGVEVLRSHVSAGAKNYNSVSGQDHEAAWEEFTLANAASYLTTGANVVAVHMLNSSLTSNDASFDLELAVPLHSGGPPTPGASNSVFAANSAPYLRELAQSVQQPTPGQDVVISIRASDPQGVQSVQLQYQLVNPGDFIDINDPRYATTWTTLPMVDDGTAGDLAAGDGVYTATLSESLQTHRRLVRYRIAATDGLGAAVVAPFADDPQSNFAYFVYGETPTWTGAVQPSVTAPVAYDASVQNSVATYHLITTRQDHVDAQYIPNSTQPGGYTGSDYRWHGTLVYDGVVYDHITFRARGGVWRYAMGKNMWKFDFNRGHGFQARDDYGNAYEVGWDKVNLSSLVQQGNFWHRGEQGLFESVGFKLFNLAGVSAPNTNFVQFRIVESANEIGANQYSSDFQGLYLAVEQLDGRFLEEHHLPDGNLYKMEAGTGVGGIGGESNNQGDYPEASDSSDLIAFKTTYQSGTQSAAWWDANLDLEQYYSYRAIVEGIHHYDIGDGKNYFFFHNPETGKWETIPWDLDLTWADNMYGSGNEPFRSRVLAYPEYMLEYRNRMRELRDLLYNVEQVGLVVDETAAHVYSPGQPSLVDADRAMWDYNPILTSSYTNPSKAGHGLYYAGGGGIPAPGSFAGMMQQVKDYAATRGAWIDATILTASEEGAVPNTPTISYAGASGFPVDGLDFAAGAYSDPNGSPFAKMEWRIGEISNPNTPGFDPNQPWKYEVDAVWESGEQATYASNLAVPSNVLAPGNTYRARVRMQDNTGRWSHWSAPIEFTASGAVALPTLAITELHYNPATNPYGEAQELEFIEVLNTGTQTLDISGMQLTTFANDPYVFAGGLSLAPGQRIVVAKNPGAFQAVYGTGINLAPDGYGGANLSNGGETIVLATPGGLAIQSIAYDDGVGWPTAADGSGPSLEIIDPLANPNDPANWRASAMTGGSPGWDGIPGLAGDYDADSDVDGNDFLAWQRQLGQKAPALTGADGSGNLVVDSADLGVWRAEFAGAAVATASSATIASVGAAVVAADEDNAIVKPVSAISAADAVFAAGDFTGLFTTPIESGISGSRNYRPRRRF
jgi:hypothetical protein